MRTVLVIPARDEAASIGVVVQELGAAVRREAEHLATIVVDDGSGDQTAAIARRHGAVVVLTTESRGLPNAFKTGVAAALELEPDVIVHADGDGQHPPSAVGTVLRRYAEEGGLVLGNRLWQRPPGMTQAKYRWNLYLSELMSSLVGTLVLDSQTGCRAFSAQVASDVVIQSTHTYTQEQILRASHLGHKISNADIEYRPRLDGESRLIRRPTQYLARVLADIDELSATLGLTQPTDYSVHPSLRCD